MSPRPAPLSPSLPTRAARAANLFQVIPGLTGKAYVGKSGMVRASLSNVIRVLWPNASGGVSDAFLIESKQADVLKLSAYYIDMDVAGKVCGSATGRNSLCGGWPVAGGSDVGFPDLHFADARTRP